MMGIGSLMNVGDMTADRAHEQQLQNLRSALNHAKSAGKIQEIAGGINAQDASNPDPDYRRGEIRTTDNARRLFESASTPEERKMRETASEFVSILYGMMFKEMDKAVERTGFLDGGHTEETFRTMVFDDYAKTAALQGSNPMAHRIYETLYAANKAQRAVTDESAPAPEHSTGLDTLG